MASQDGKGRVPKRDAFEQAEMMAMVSTGRRKSIGSHDRLVYCVHAEISDAIFGSKVIYGRGIE